MAIRSAKWLPSLRRFQASPCHQPWRTMVSTWCGRTCRLRNRRKRHGLTQSCSAANLMSLKFFGSGPLMLSGRHPSLMLAFFRSAMSIRNLEHLFRPASVAVIGASDRPGSVGATVWRNLAAGGFQGPIWPVNRKHRSVGGVAAYARVADLPAPPELAVICTPAATVPGLIGQLGQAGCRAAVVLSGGMDGPGEDGRSLRSVMLEAARPFLLRILGPNCVGLLVPRLGLNASFAPAAAAPSPGKLAFVSQSGALVTAVLDWAGGQGIGFSCFVSLGDGSDVDFGDLLDYLAGDEHTEAILLYAESVRQARKFMSAARAAARSKPTLIVKAGRSPASAKAAFSHTGALAGADLVYDAAIARAGMLRVNSTDALFDAVTTLARTRPPRGERLAILTNGGGPGVMATDALIAGGGSLATLAGPTVEALDRCLPPNWSHGNPVDIIGDAPLTRYRDALQVLVAAAEVDAVLLIHAPTAIADAGAIAGAVAPLIRTAAAQGCPVYTCWMGGASVAAARRLFSAAGLPLFGTPEAAVRAHLQLLAYRRNQQLLMQVPAAVAGAEPQREQARALLASLLASTPASQTDSSADRRIGEAGTKALLKLYGIEVVDTVVSADTESAVRAARQLGYPVAVKLVSPDISHKSAVGGVVLDVEDDAGVRAAIAAIGERLGRLAPQAMVTGFTVQQMVRRSGAVEPGAGCRHDVTHAGGAPAGRRSGPCPCRSACRGRGPDQAGATGGRLWRGPRTGHQPLAGRCRRCNCAGRPHALACATSRRRHARRSDGAVGDSALSPRTGATAGPAGAGAAGRASNPPRGRSCPRSVFCRAWRGGCAHAPVRFRARPVAVPAGPLHTDRLRAEDGLHRHTPDGRVVGDPGRGPHFQRSGRGGGRICHRRAVGSQAHGTGCLAVRLPARLLPAPWPACGDGNHACRKARDAGTGAQPRL